MREPSKTIEADHGSLAPTVKALLYKPPPKSGSPSGIGTDTRDVSSEKKLSNGDSTFASSDEEAKPPREPLLQFGILVPSALRTAQTSFRSGVTEGIIGMAETWFHMRELERAINEARSQRNPLVKK